MKRDRVSEDANLDLVAIAKASGLSEARVLECIKFAKNSVFPYSERVSVVENGVRQPLVVTRLGVGPLTTRWGVFWKFVFNVSDRWSEYAAIVRADLDRNHMPLFRNGERVLVRLDSGCTTGQVFGDLTCECREQLDLAQAIIADSEEEGLVICIPRQDGRGMGLQSKLATLTLQSELRLDN